MEAIMLHLKLRGGVKDFPLAYVMRQHVKVAHTSFGCGTCLNIDDEMITTVCIVDAKSNHKKTHNWLDRKYVNS